MRFVVLAIVCVLLYILLLASHDPVDYHQPEPGKNEHKSGKITDMSPKEVDKLINEFLKPEAK
jgi:hypothetical protein